MKLKLELDLSKCCGCGACAIACMDQNDIDLSTGVRPFRCVFRQETRSTGRIEYYSMSCMHCDNAPCVTACPSGCLYKDEETGLTLYDNTNCIGCHSCAMACPFGAPTFGPDNKMRKCDGCIEGRPQARLRQGLHLRRAEPGGRRQRSRTRGILAGRDVQGALGQPEMR